MTGDPTDKIDAWLDGELSDTEATELEAWLSADAARMEHFVEASLLHRALREAILAQHSEFLANDEPSEALSLGVPINEPLGGVWGNSFSPFSSGWPVAYLVATVILGVGLLIGALVHVSEPGREARQSAALPSPLSPLHSSSPFVGRITGMVDCQWDRQVGWVKRSAAPPETKSIVSLGDKFALSSGLMEITYDTGAKVILQGPTVYEVESAAGGFLQVGRLLGKVTDENAKGFRVRTPTAELVDLGTEFGVEVVDDGASEIHVLRGLVQTHSVDARGTLSDPLQLREGEARRYPRAAGETGSGGSAVTAIISADRAKFEQMRILKSDERRERWQAYNRRLREDPALVAYYTFEFAPRDRRRLSNVSAAGDVLDGQVEGAEWVDGRLPGKYALYFHGPGSQDRVVLPAQERFKFAGPFSVAVWFKVARFAADYQPLVAKGGASWRVERHESTDFVTFDTNFTASMPGQPWTVTHGQTGVGDGRWHLAVAVYEPVGNVATKRLYIDGHLDAENESPLSLAQNDDPVWLGAHSVTENCEFQGHIDEVALLTRALSGEEVQAMFEAGNPGNAAKVATKK